MFRIMFAAMLIAISIPVSVYAEEAAVVKYTCPMHPQIIRDHPGKCPICGMDLVPLEGSGAGHDHSASPLISIPAETLQKTGVRTEKAAKSAFGGAIRATGTILANERLRRDMAAQVEGRVEDLKFSAEGDHLKKGDLFYTLASPELQRLQSDYLLALRDGAKQAEGAARKLRLMGVEDRVIAAIAKNGSAFEHVPFYAPADGILTKIEIRNGHLLKAGDEIGHIQDLSTVWVDAALSENDLARVHDGDNARVMMGGETTAYMAKIEHIHPTIAEETRTGIARLVVENPGEKLKPGGYASVEFSVEASERLAVPSAAVLRSAGGDHLIVALGEGKFQAREVRVGISSGGRTEILSGLKEGEEVVANGQFLLDSESNLREGLEKLGGGK